MATISIKKRIPLLQQIEKGLKDANKTIKGELPRKTIKEMLNTKLR